MLVGGDLLRVGEHEACLGLLEVGHVGGGVLLDKDGLALGSHVAVNLIRHFHFELFITENMNIL